MDNDKISKEVTKKMNSNSLVFQGLSLFDSFCNRFSSKNQNNTGIVENIIKMSLPDQKYLKEIGLC